MRKPHFKNKAARGAFTLIEILVVLVIMGFLVSLVAPKLSGIVDSAVDTNCDTNQERLRTVLNGYVAQNNALPSGLTNLVVTDGTIAAAENVAIPSVDDGDKANGAEFLSADFADRFKPQVHFINKAEAEELVGMGVKGFKYVGKNNGTTLVKDGAHVDGTSTNKLVETNVSGSMATGVPVMMAGVGIPTAAGAASTAVWATGNTITIAGSAVTENTTAQIAITAGTAASANANGTLTRMDEGKAVGRILMGVNNSGELVQSGMLDEAGTCPGQLQNADKFEFGNYVIVLPRLQATVDRLTEGSALATPTSGSLVLNSDEIPTLHAVALGVDTGEAASGDIIVGRTPGTGYKYFTAQTAKDHTTSCPEGHTWGANADSYAIKVPVNS